MPALYELLTASTVSVGLTATTKDDALHAMIDLLEGHPSVDDLTAVRRAVLEREAIMSTGVGTGLGLPHAKTDAVRRTVVAFATLRTPIAYDAIDGAPVDLLFLLVGPERAQTEHIRLLSRISRLMQRTDLRAALCAAPNVETILALFEASEATLLDD
ncbi:MAG: PTS sugar transporter subunit IIA [Bacteroidota bacterium]